MDPSSSSSSSSSASSPPAPHSSSYFSSFWSGQSAFNTVVQSEMSSMSSLLSRTPPPEDNEIPAEWKFFNSCVHYELKWGFAYGLATMVASNYWFKRKAIPTALRWMGAGLFGVVGSMIYLNGAGNNCGTEMLLMEGEKATKARERLAVACPDHKVLLKYEARQVAKQRQEEQNQDQQPKNS